MRIFIYEYISASGIGQHPDSQDHSLWVEGNAMLSAIRDDFACIPGVELLSSDDFCNGVREAEYSFVIAPETDGILEQLNADVRRLGSQLLGSPAETIQITSDKYRTYQLWRDADVLTPVTQLGERDVQLPYPRIIKLRYGAGSTDIRIVYDLTEFNATIASRRNSHIVQQYHTGIPASVAFLCRGREFYPLLPCFQALSRDGLCTYRGGFAPLPPSYAERAVSIARRAIEAIPGEFNGYMGVDVLLGNKDSVGVAHPTPDLAIEINARLTSSYHGLRKLAQFNIAEALLRLASGEQLGNLSWYSGFMQWSPAGRTERFTLEDAENLMAAAGKCVPPE